MKFTFLPVLIFVLAFAITGCGKKKDNICATNSDCPRGQVCTIDMACRTPQEIEVNKQKLTMQQDAECKKKRPCKEKGICTYNPEARVCVAAEGDYCENSEHCDRYGFCSFSKKDGRCVALTDADCDQSSNLSSRGETSAEGGRCIATNDSCVASPICKEKGYCTAVEKRRTNLHDRKSTRCAARTDEDCEGSELCRDENKCRVELNRSRGDYQTCVEKPTKPYMP